MEILLHNPLADMYGPIFLVIYFTVIVTTLVICYRRVRSYTGSTRALPPIPLQPDPYEVAYLRGGENEVVRLAIFLLMERGYLQTEGDKQKRLHSITLPNSVDGPLTGLSPIEAEVLHFLSSPRTAREIFTSSLPSYIKRLCAIYDEQMKQLGLLASEDARAYTGMMGFKGALVIFGLGGYKLFAAVSNGHNNVGLLALMSIMAVPALFLICRTSRLTASGRQYLERLRLAFAGLKSRPQGHTENRFAAGDIRNSEGEVNFPQPDYLPLTVAVFGMSVLTAVQYPDFYTMFPRSTQISSGGGGCGTAVGCGSASSCSASSCSGGSCGGGGGGCSGGGGCGGGGCGGCGGG